MQRNGAVGSSNNKGKTKEAILRAALDIFSEKGFDGCAVSDISKKAGVTKSLIHYHFQSKEQLWAEAVDLFFHGYAARFEEYMAPLLEDSDMMEEGLYRYFLLLKESPEFVKMMASITSFSLRNGDLPCCSMQKNSDESEDSHLMFMQTFSSRVIQRLQKFQQQGIVRKDIPADMLMAIIWSLCEHWHMSKIRMLSRIEDEKKEVWTDDRYFEAIAKFFKQGVAAP